jgi:hypothetical protein
LHRVYQPLSNTAATERREYEARIGVAERKTDHHEAIMGLLPNFFPSVASVVRFFILSIEFA